MCIWGIFQKRCFDCKCKNKYVYRCEICVNNICIKCWDPLSNMCMNCYNFFYEKKHDIYLE